jgi:hypothetical protein
MFRTFACSTAFAVLLLVTPQAQTATTIRIWKVGSPHSGDTPHTELPPALAREAGSRGWRLSIEAFPAQGFAGRFFAAVRACQEITDRQPDLGGAIRTRLAEPPFVPFRITVNLGLTSASYWV